MSDSGSMAHTSSKTLKTFDMSGLLSGRVFLKFMRQRLMLMALRRRDLRSN